jgi:hypothetical protein
MPHTHTSLKMQLTSLPALFLEKVLRIHAAGDVSQGKAASYYGETWKDQVFRCVSKKTGPYVAMYMNARLATASQWYLCCFQECALLSIIVSWISELRIYRTHADPEQLTDRGTGWERENLEYLNHDSELGGSLRLELLHSPSKVASECPFY